ncbi:hypothetical protein CDL12_25597 [Handroanthus impetiginosus]|uniref:Uncharacterized protein n=1 Tax=Handroanthus impetiginosus TaxID=429701 RepID=A0A2G9GA94_9LAMI|nr:hypothetical protein CDL12_25597 [Handroanthus impetiginosus]
MLFYLTTSSLDVSFKKFIVGKFLDYKTVDLKSITSQVQKLQIILHEIHAENMVATRIEKIPPLWKDLNYLKHKRKEMGFEDLIIKLRIEEDNRISEIKIGSTMLEAKAKLVEPNSNISKKRKRQGFGENKKGKTAVKF